MNTRVGLFVYIVLYVVVMGMFGVLEATWWRQGRPASWLTVGALLEAYLLFRVVWLALKLRRVGRPPGPPRDDFFRPGA